MFQMIMTNMGYLDAYPNGHNLDYNLFYGPMMGEINVFKLGYF